jgi:hypothetical protein
MTCRSLRVAFLLITSLAVGCRDARHSASADAPVVLFDRAFITREHVAEAMAFEADLAKRYAKPAPAGESWFEVLEGDAKVLVVAGHATQHMRQGAFKSQDGGTGGLAIMLHRLAGCPTIMTRYQSPRDPNYYDDDSDFKLALKQMVQRHKHVLVLDIHDSSSGRPYDIDFGTVGGTSVLGQREHLERLVECLHREGMRNFSQDYFAASRRGTVTQFVKAMGVPCVQLEFNSSWLPQPAGGPVDLVQRQRVGQVIQGMVRFVEPYANAQLIDALKRARPTPTTTTSLP